MATIKDLEKYIDYEFSSGCYTGEDYKSFQTKYINFLRSKQSEIIRQIRHIISIHISALSSIVFSCFIRYHRLVIYALLYAFLWRTLSP